VTVCVLKHGLTSADCNIIDGAQVGGQFCKSHCSIMWHAGHRILQRHEHHGLGRESSANGHGTSLENSTYQAFIHTSQTHGIDLTNIGGFCLQQLLECNTVLRCLASSDPNSIWFESFADRCMTKDIIWVCWLYSNISSNPVEDFRKRSNLTFDENWFELNQMLHVLYRFWYAPHLRLRSDTQLSSWRFMHT
jgi:hypothetical protein